MGRIAVLERSQDGTSVSIEDLPNLEPKEGQILVQNSIIGMSTADILTKYQLIEGLFKNNRIVLGYEGVGTVLSVGLNVKGFKPGQKVAYINPTAGACATQCCVPALYTVAVPQQLSEKDLAAVFLRGMLAHALTNRTFIISSETNVLIHDLASATSHIVSQFARLRKPKILIGTINSEEQKKEAIAHGICDHILNYNSETFTRDIMRLTNNVGVHVAYDGIGSAFVMHKTISSLCRFGMLVLYNESIFRIPHVSILELAKRSLYVSVPSVFDYKHVREEFVLTANDIFSLLTSNILSPNYIEYNLDGLDEALKVLENQQSPNSIIISI